MLRARAGSSGTHFSLQKHKKAHPKVTRPRRREANSIDLSIFDRMRKTRFPHGPADPTTTVPRGAAQDVSSEMPTFFQKLAFRSRRPRGPRLNPTELLFLKKQHRSIAAATEATAATAAATAAATTIR